MKLCLTIVVVFCVVATHKMLPTQNNPYAVPTIEVAVQAQTATITANESVSSSQFSRTVKTVKWNETICGDSRVQNNHTMILVSREEVLHYASKYWSGQNLDIGVALTVKEGQRDLNCVADEMLYFQGRKMYGAPTADGRHWGDSVGMFSYRTIIEQTGKGGCDDREYQLGNIERQIECANLKATSKNGWRHWSMYLNGGWKQAIGK